MMDNEEETEDGGEDGNHGVYFESPISIIACIQNSSITSVEIIFASYFFVYVQVSHNNTNIIISSFGVIGMKFIPFLNSKLYFVTLTPNSNFRLTHFNILIIRQVISCTIITGLCLFSCPNWLN